MFEYILLLIGAVMLLVAFVTLQWHGLSPHSFLHLWLNFSGAILLSVAAVPHRRWEIVVIAGLWAIAAAARLFVGHRGRL